MDSDVLVKVEGVSKKFCRDLKRSLWYGVKDISSEILGISPSGELRKKEFWAVNDVSFELRRGECLGLIGHNGAGKSTLLKMLNGLIKPDKGRITMKGRIGALIELGAGFNPILTGRENIYNNGAVLGFSKKEIDKKLEAIIDFAEIEEFIDTPVQNYSSGMKVRLGFAVAAQMEPDVLIIDEVLAVGDMKFRIKCFNTLNQLLANSAVIFVSHSMSQISKISRKLIFMANGQVKFSGTDINDGLELYFRSQRTEISSNDYDGEVKIIDRGVRLEEEITIKLSFFSETRKNKFGVLLTIFDQEFRPVGIVNSIYKDKVYNFAEGNNQQCALKMENLFSNGTYSINVSLISVEDSISGFPFCMFQNAIKLEIDNKKYTSNVSVQLNANWE